MLGSATSCPSEATEPTAAVDALSARLIDESVVRLQQGKTLIVISHDLSDFSHFDRVLVLEDARITEAPPRAAHGPLLTLVPREKGTA